ncbi:unnamed protein product [Parascedosporium putredinis]|uniref:BHLH domain-containing protein n=1 Tax=Parascedosporium putredinis TaxID=1442378 RepID=A0A9P1H0E9_9PEZI|nr:unnamed protein product [Parascedosporium putredinis]CAI7992766.1 unnamed protein product [Parascedosporium putredinis]
MSGYSGSPLASELNPDDPNYLKARAQLSQSMQRKASNPRSPMTPKTTTIHAGFGPQPIRTSGLADKSPSGQWMPTPGGSIQSYTSGFSSPIQQGLVPINEVMMKGGTSMPAKLGVAPNAVSSQEMKRKRRRESHNLVERRARRAAGAGNITTGLPLEEKDKGPNKGDILNGAVSWTRDLMWMLHLKLQQQEELMNCIAELGGQFPFELTEDEKRMQTELMDAMSKNEAIPFSYTRTAGSGLRVPQHTDYRGAPIGSNRGNGDNSVSPDNGGLGDVGDPSQFWHDPEDDRSGNNSINFKEEDEYDMDLTQ